MGSEYILASAIIAGVVRAKLGSSLHMCSIVRTHLPVEPGLELHPRKNTPVSRRYGNITLEEGS
jgi:hypothetical protein